MDIIKARFEEHIALAQLVAQSEIMQQVADAAAIIKKALAGCPPDADGVIAEK